MYFVAEKVSHITSEIFVFFAYTSDSPSATTHGVDPTLCIDMFPQWFAACCSPICHARYKFISTRTRCWPIRSLNAEHIGNPTRDRRQGSWSGGTGDMVFVWYFGCGMVLVVLRSGGMVVTVLRSCGMVLVVLRSCGVVFVVLRSCDMVLMVLRSCGMVNVGRGIRGLIVVVLRSSCCDRCDCCDRCERCGCSDGGGACCASSGDC